MKERLTNQTKYNPNTATQEELASIISLADQAIDRHRSDKFIATEHLRRRFGDKALATVTDINAWRGGRSQEEFDLDLTPDGGDAA